MEAEFKDGCSVKPGSQSDGGEASSYFTPLTHIHLDETRNVCSFDQNKPISTVKTHVILTTEHIAAGVVPSQDRLKYLSSLLLSLLHSILLHLYESLFNQVPHK